MVQGKINRGRHIDHPAGRHSIRTKQCPPLPSPHKTEDFVHAVSKFSQLNSNTSHILHSDSLDCVVYPPFIKTHPNSSTFQVLASSFVSYRFSKYSCTVSHPFFCVSRLQFQPSTHAKQNSLPSWCCLQTNHHL